MKRTRNAVRNVIFGGLLKGYQILVPFIMRTLLIGIWEWNIWG